MWNDRYADHAAVRPNTLEGHFDGVGQKSGDRNQQAGGLPVSKIATRIARRQLRQKQEEERANGQRKADEHYMRLALQQARRAQALGEVPIGCVIVKEGQVIARGYNRRNTDHNTLSHAELNAIRKASRKLQDWRLEGCTIYITLEPCQMCSGAIVQSRIDRCVVGAMNPKAGCAGSVMNLLRSDDGHPGGSLQPDAQRILPEASTGEAGESCGKPAASAGTYGRAALIKREQSRICPREAQRLQFRQIKAKKNRGLRRF